MIEHSPEPWSIGMKAADGANTLVMAGGLIVADCAPDWCEDGPEETNARRIVACVNACRGIPTGTLERIQPWELHRIIDAWERMLRKHDDQPITENPTMEPL